MSRSTSATTLPASASLHPGCSASNGWNAHPACRPASRSVSRRVGWVSREPTCGIAWSPVPLPSSSENSARRSPCPALSAFPIATHSRPSGVTSRLGELQLSIPGKARRCWSITLGSEDSHGGCRPRCDYCLCRPAFRTRKRLLSVPAGAPPSSMDTKERVSVRRCRGPAEVSGCRCPDSLGFKPPSTPQQAVTLGQIGSVK